MRFYGIQKLSLVDYDTEISCTLFTKGCNFRCPFCHNYELVEDNDNTPGAIDPEDLKEFLETHKKRLTGVVVTGGEPTIYKDLPDMIKMIKSYGYKVKLDTNGTNPNMLIDLIENKLIDYVAIDIKNSYSMYALTVGLKSLDLTNLEICIEYLNNHDFPYEFRTTLINEYHSTESIREMGEWIKGAKKLFLQKFELSENVPLKSLNSVPKEKALEYKKILEEYIDQVSLRGYE